MSKIYDCVIVGGGPAGLSAAIYMGRFLRETLVIDAGAGRSSFGQLNDNYLGFPNGVAADELRVLGRQHAERFGVEFVEDTVERLEQCELPSQPTDSQLHAIVEPTLRGEADSLLKTPGRDFIAHTPTAQYRGRTVILCTGVCDIWPDVPEVETFVGKSLFWCITCDGFRTLNKRVVIFGKDDDAATSALQFQMYTCDIAFVSRPGTLDCSDEKIQAMEQTGIEMIEGEAERIEGAPDQIEAVRLKDGRRLPADLVFSLLGVTIKNKLAVDVGATLDSEGYVRVNEDGNTSVPGLFAAGDLSGMHTHQVIAAAHEGAEAAQTANHYLYASYQRVS